MVGSGLLPIRVTLLFGGMAGWVHDADQKVAAALNTMVPHYALPVSLFTGTVSTSRATLLWQWPLALLLCGMAAPFTMTCLAMRHPLHRPLGVDTYGLPAIPFTGICLTRFRPQNVPENGCLNFGIGRLAL